MENTNRPQYKDKSFLLNKSEQVLLSRLREAAPKLQIHTQVSMSQLFNITGNKGFLQIAEIGRKSIDFLLCREDTSILLAIELNGPTHEKASQKKSDAKKKAALNEAGIPLITIKADAIPDIDALRKELAPHIVARTKHEAAKIGNAQPKPSPQPKKQSKVAEQSQIITPSANKSCKHCNSTNLEIAYAKSYYFRCLKCIKNTAIRLFCPKCNRTEKIRKAGNNFFAECTHCNTSRLFHTNA